MPYRKSKYYSTKKVVVKPKVHWALTRNTANLELPMPPANAQHTAFINPICYSYTTQEISSANADTNYQPGLTKKVKHIKVDITKQYFDSATQMKDHLSKLKVYLIYLPQGVSFNSTGDGNQPQLLASTLTHHPEWVMAERVLDANGSDSGKFVANTTLNCRLSRNLKSGDRVVLVISALWKNMNSLDYTSHGGKHMHFNCEWSYASCL